MSPTSRLMFLLLVAALVPLPDSAQVTTGTPPFGSFGGGPDIINLANLNAHWTFPVLNKSGRGMNFSYNLDYDSSIWYPVGSSGNQSWQYTTDTNWGWTTSIPRGGHVSYLTTTVDHTVVCGDVYVTSYTNWTYYDGFGTPHPFSGQSDSWTSSPRCNSTGTDGFTSTASDGSGYTIAVNASTINSLNASDGAVINPVTGALTLQDRNGNKITSSNSSGTTSYYDTLSSTAPVLTVSGSGTSISPTVFTYTPPNTSSSRCASTNTSGVACYTVNYTNYTVATNFGNSTIHEYKSPAAVPLVASITLPDGSQYTLTYEPTPSTPSQGACTPYAGTTCTTARIASVQLPTGGTISYLYYNSNNNFPACTTGNNGVFSDGSASCLLRTTPDGTWTYARTFGSGSASATLITAPQLPYDSASNQTIVQFQSTYETQRDIYQGPAPTFSSLPISESTLQTSGLLREVQTCYNASSFPCTTTSVALPITQRTIIDQYGSSGLQCKHTYVYNTVGGLTEQDDDDYGSGGPGGLLRQILITYASLPPNINAFRQQVTVKNGSGTVVAQTNYNYDETSVTAPTNQPTPQHTSVSGSRGNLTSINYPVSGLTSHFTYYDTGTLNAPTDVNGGQTTYTYGSLSATCGNAFPTGITEAISTLTQSYAWNCTGGVMTQLTDENGNNASVNYNDLYYWRPTYTTDQMGAQTNFCYGLLSSSTGTCAVNGTQIETTLNFNSNNSTVDTLTTVDGLGRAHIQQKRQLPTATNFDSAEQDFDSLGRPSRSTMPYSGNSGQTSSTAPAVTTTYDALGRPLSVTDAGGGTATYSYMNNDVLVTVGPAPTGENTKKRQLEYDGLGRLTSVCEITGGTTPWPSASCGQNTSATGYLTKYTYDVLGNLLTVTQNAQATSNQQTRSYIFDAMSRLKSEGNPETGSTTYSYDSDTTCTPASSGDLVKRVDAVGNTTCYAYDALHRVTSITYPSGTYSGNTPSKTFVYDSATVNGVPMTNVKARLAEAYTGPSSGKVTDLGFSYTARGEVFDVYESTPHSSGYYHVNQTYWPHGAPSQLSQLVGLPTISYGGTIGSTVGLDGEGRITQVTGSSSQNPVTGVNYNRYGTPPQVTVTFGSGDSDVFNYDANTARMTQYQFNINGQSDTGALTWNANSTLQKLVITDALANTTDSQTCNYGYDDVVRIASANCGTAANQTFSYDPFGNISKSGSPYQFQPGYNTATNHITTVGNVTATYDNNGNVTNDGVHTYTWDADGNSITIDGTGLTFDAFDRAVEKNVSGTYTEIVYAPTGAKLALMSGQTLQEAFVSLPGKASAVYSSSGLDHYRHSDWLGSARLTSSTSGTVLSTTAYAPFGETYAQSGTADVSFTGQNSDTVGTDYDFLYREYSTQGRWPSPDPSGIAAVSPTFPQSWNRYAYVRNNPLSLTDPLGLDCVYFDEDGNVSEVKSGDCWSENDNGYYVDGTIWGGKSGITVDDKGDWMSYNYTPYDGPEAVLGGGQCIGDCGAYASVFVFGLMPSSEPIIATWNAYTPPVQSSFDLWHMTPQQQADVRACIATGGEYGGETIEPPHAGQAITQVRSPNGKPLQYPGNNKPIIPNIKGAKMTPSVTGPAGILEWAAGGQRCVQNLATK